MNNNIKYRIKTEQEFIDDFGHNWRSIVTSYFIYDMDYILGLEIEKIYVERYLTNKEGTIIGSLTTNIPNYPYKISGDMIKIIIKPPNYNKKNFIYD